MTFTVCIAPEFEKKRLLNDIKSFISKNPKLVLPAKTYNWCEDRYTCNNFQKISDSISNFKCKDKRVRDLKGIYVDEMGTLCGLSNKKNSLPVSLNTLDNYDLKLILISLLQ